MKLYYDVMEVVVDKDYEKLIKKCKTRKTCKGCRHQGECALYLDDVNGEEHKVFPYELVEGGKL